MHSLLFHQPGHFHAALLLRSANPRVARSIHVYATPGPDLDRFTGLVAGFNSRAEEPTDWDVVVHPSDDPLAHLIDDRLGESVVVAGRNEPKLAAIRRLHDAEFNVLADKPWITTGAALDNLHRVTAGPPLVMDIMTERHDPVSRLRRLVVATDSVFGRFVDDGDGVPALEFDSIHHLCKIVEGRPLRRPDWYYDVRVQGDGLVDIQSHMVDQAQWLIEDEDEDGGGTVEEIEPPSSGRASSDGVVLDRAERWSTPVPLTVFTESTGVTAFPTPLMPDVDHGVLHLACNGEIDYRLREVRVRQRAVWRTHSPVGGGDAHRSVARGTAANVIVLRGPETDHRPQIHVGPSDDRHLGDQLSRHLDAWGSEVPGLSMRPSPLGYELLVPTTVEMRHEAAFPRVLDTFLDHVEMNRWSSTMARTIRTRYTLLARAHETANDRPTIQSE